MNKYNLFIFFKKIIFCLLFFFNFYFSQTNSNNFIFDINVCKKIQINNNDTSNFRSIFIFFKDSNNNMKYFFGQIKINNKKLKFNFNNMVYTSKLSNEYDNECNIDDTVKTFKFFFKPNNFFKSFYNEINVNYLFMFSNLNFIIMPKEIKYDKNIQFEIPDSVIDFNNVLISLHNLNSNITPLKIYNIDCNDIPYNPLNNGNRLLLINTNNNSNLSSANQKINLCIKFRKSQFVIFNNYKFLINTDCELCKIYNLNTNN